MDYRMSILVLALSACLVTSIPLGTATSVEDRTMALLMRIAENTSDIKVADYYL
jgi:hypothetical protein